MLSDRVIGMKQKKRSDIITFKVDKELNEVLQRMPNRSNFIRSAILSALRGTCPLCHGTGVLNMSQSRHWDSFMENHAVEECGICNETHLVCTQQPQNDHPHNSNER